MIRAKIDIASRIRVTMNGGPLDRESRPQLDAGIARALPVTVAHQFTTEVGYTACAIPPSYWPPHRVMVSKRSSAENTPGKVSRSRTT